MLFILNIFFKNDICTVISYKYSRQSDEVHFFLKFKSVSILFNFLFYRMVYSLGAIFFSKFFFWLNFLKVVVYVLDKY